MGPIDRWRALAGGYPGLLAVAAMVVSTLAVYARWLDSPDTIGRHWDGPHYLYLARTLYRIPEAHPFVPYGLPRTYFACHLPALPLLIRALVPLAGGDYPFALLLAMLLSSAAAAFLFHELLRSGRLVRSPLWTSLLFAVLPPRWLIYHSIGASEPLFLVFVLGALLAHRKNRPGLVIVAIVLATLTRLPGALLIPSFGLLYLGERRFRRLAALPLAGLGLLGLAGFHHLMFGDSLAYFHWNVSEQGLLHLAPLDTFRAYAQAPDFHALEYLYWTYGLYALGTLVLWPHRDLFCYASLGLLLNVFVFHIDLARYFLPLAPFALLIGFDPVLSSRPARVAFPLLVYLSYTYAYGLVPDNLVVDWVWSDLAGVLDAR